MIDLKFEDLKAELLALAGNNDCEIAHSEADKVLAKIALSTTLTAAERVELVSLYTEVEKWYS